MGSRTFFIASVRRSRELPFTMLSFDWTCQGGGGM